MLFIRPIIFRNADIFASVSLSFSDGSVHLRLLKVLTHSVVLIFILVLLPIKSSSLNAIASCLSVEIVTAHYFI